MADLTAAQLTVLATELNTDPKALGFAGKNNAQCAAILNTAGASSETINPGTLPTWQVTAAIVGTEWTALSQANKDLLAFYLNQGTIDTTSANVRTAIGGMFNAGATKTALTNLVNRPATRGEILFGVNIIIAASNVGQALNRAS